MAGSAKRIVTRSLLAVVLVLVVAAGALAFSHRQEINDHFAAQRFDASPEIVQLTASMNLTDAGRRVFWASEPTLDASQRFNEQCAQVDHSEDGHILGCYTSSRIHLFEVTDDRLEGIVEVTAAHELLHAAFARLGNQERTSLAERLGELYDELAPNDPQLSERMSVYSSLSKIAFANELHSVLGTEQRELPSWLEEHYARWLEDRSSIVDFYDGYHAVFDELKKRSEELQASMAELRQDVEQRSAAYDKAVEQFNSEWDEFIRRNEAYEFSANPEEFYRLRDDFYARRDALSAEMSQLNADIARYDEMRAELLELSDLNHELEQQLDSELAPPAPAPNTED